MDEKNDFMNFPNDFFSPVLNPIENDDLVDRLMGSDSYNNVKQEYYLEPQNEEKIRIPINNKLKREFESMDQNERLSYSQNTRNTYINKIQNLFTEDKSLGLNIPKPLNSRLNDMISGNFAFSNNDEKSIYSDQRQMQPDDVLGNDKKVKNRKSARESRLRKKMYLEMLEQKFSETKKELDYYKNELAIYKQKLDRITKEHQSVKTTFYKAYSNLRREKFLER